MNYFSPLSIEEVSSILKEQVQASTWLSRINIFQRPTSQVSGKIINNYLILRCTNDPFSKCLVGELKRKEEGTLLKAEWRAGFWSNIYGFHKLNEDTITSFLKEWAKLNICP